MKTGKIRFLLFCSLAVLVTTIAFPVQASSFRTSNAVPNDKTPEEQSMREPGKVVGVLSGDSLIVVYKGGRQLVGLQDVKAPRKGEPRFEEAMKLLQSLLERKAVELGFGSPPERKRDQQGRLLAYVFADGENVNEQMVNAGWPGSDSEFPQPRLETPQRLKSGPPSRVPEAGDKLPAATGGTQEKVVRSKRLQVEPKVYITRRDKTYHRETCAIVKQVGGVPILKSEAVRLGYKPCNRCRP